jgi:hypothetical protein
MTDLEDRLPNALNRLADRAGHAENLADQVRRASRRHRLMVAAPMAAVLAVCAVVAIVWTTVARTDTGPVTGGDPAPASACVPLTIAPLPIWARAGFSGDGNGVPYALSASGGVAAIVFGNPLTAPPAADHNNKILWVVRAGVPVQVPSAAGTVGPPSQDLVITGHLEGTDVTTTVDTGAAPGPSIVDMPAAGCWHLELSWGGQTDSINLAWSTP